jgi:RNA polymerase sigma-70 factor (ECF subfamily)
MLASVACEVTVVPVDHGQAGAHVAGQIEGGNAGTEREGREGVPKIVDPAQRLDPGGTLCRLPLAVAEVVQVEVAAPLGWEQQWAVRTRRLAFERVQCDRLQRHRPQARLCLGALQPTLREGTADVDHTRLTIDVTPLERALREQYVGQWLPEPLLTDSAPDAAAQAETADSLSMAFLVLLESLTPVERAVFLLREVFDYDYAEIAEIVQRSEDNCRQLYVRARRHVDQGRPRFEASREQRDELARRFFAAAQLGDTNALVELLAADVVVYGDGGGKAPSWTDPIYGRERVAKLMVATLAPVERLGGSVMTTELNGQPGVKFVDEEGRIAAVMSLEIADGVVQTIRGITNPDKLAHLGPVADLRAILRRRRMMAERDD